VVGATGPTFGFFRICTTVPLSSKETSSISVFHEVNTSTVLGQPSFWSGGIRYSVGVKALSLVQHSDRDFSVCVASALYVNVLTGILTIAMDHGVRKDFTQGCLDIDLASIRRSKVQNEPHELIYE
jgi:hypothetical protein